MIKPFRDTWSAAMPSLFREAIRFHNGHSGHLWSKSSKVGVPRGQLAVVSEDASRVASLMLVMMGQGSQIMET